MTFELTPMEVETTTFGDGDSAARDGLRVQSRAINLQGSEAAGDGAAGATAGTESDDESNLIRILQNAKPVAGASFTAGMLWWLTRSGGLLTSILMGVPAWRHVDLLPVISSNGAAPAKRLDDGSDPDDDEGDDHGADGFDDSAVANLFDDPATALTAESAH